MSGETLRKLQKVTTALVPLVQSTTQGSLFVLLLDILNCLIRDFPGGPVVKNLPSNAGDTGSIPGRGTKIPHAAGQQSPRATTTGPAYHNYRAHALQLQSPCVLEPAPQLEKRKPACHN